MAHTGFDANPSNTHTHPGVPVQSATGSVVTSAPARDTAPSPRQPVEPVTSGRLVVSRGPETGREVEITAARTTIGRGRDCDLVLDDGTVSPHHADLLRQDGRYVLIDRGSLNGVYVNRKPVDRVELVDGDEIWIGKVRFVFRYAE